MFGGFMLADISFWDMFASGGAFNPGTVVVWFEMLASPDIIAFLGCVYFWKCCGLGNVRLS